MHRVPKVSHVCLYYREPCTQLPNLAVELYFLKWNKYTMIRILQDKISAS